MFLYISRTTTAHWRRYTSMDPKREYLNIYGLADEITGYIDRFNFRLNIRERSDERPTKGALGACKRCHSTDLPGIYQRCPWKMSQVMFLADVHITQPKFKLLASRQNVRFVQKTLKADQCVETELICVLFKCFVIHHNKVSVFLGQEHDIKISLALL